ncbi:MAG TPA: hypothetical protein ENH84_02880 [Phycisphaerae bacterium]|nr:hypothetical protein [Phycisphaerae bacterium]
MKRERIFKTFDGKQFTSSADAMMHEYDLYAEDAYQAHREEMATAKTYAEARRVLTMIHEEVEVADKGRRPNEFHERNRRSAAGRYE